MAEQTQPFDIAVVRSGIASAQDERILTEKRRSRDTPYDVHPLASATLADLDRVLFENIYLYPAG